MTDWDRFRPGVVVNLLTDSHEDRWRSVRAAIFDVDGVIVDSPHERAWREALSGFADPALLTTALYQAHVAGRPRLDGARAVLQRLGVPDAAGRAPCYAARKQALVSRLIEAGEFAVFPDAVRCLLALRQRRIRLAAASSSKNATGMLRQVILPPGGSVADLFDANLCGVDVRRGKPDPELFLLAAASLHVPPEQCMVVEDAPAGIRAAVAGGMLVLGVARHRADAVLLQAARADLVVADLDAPELFALLPSPSCNSEALPCARY